MKQHTPQDSRPARTIEELLPEAFARIGLKWPEDGKRELPVAEEKRPEYRQEVMRYGR